jgi:hypothetical protein
MQEIKQQIDSKLKLCLEVPINLKDTSKSVKKFLNIRKNSIESSCKNIKSCMNCRMDQYKLAMLNSQNLTQLSL